VESLFAGIGFVLVPLLPRCVVVRLARGFGSLGYGIAHRERRVGLANLDLAYGDTKSSEEKVAIIRESLQTFALGILDLFWFSLFTESRIRRYVRFDASMAWVTEPGPVVAQTAHIGNWEILGQAISLHGVPITSVATPLDNPAVNWILNRARKRTGQSIAPRKGAVRALVRKLAEGGRPAALMDQNTLPDEGGAFVPFFGLPVPVSLTAGMLAAHGKARMVFAYCIADRKGLYTAFSESTLPPPTDRLVAVRHFVRVTESVIRRHPGQWLWMYKRWKFVPEGAPIDKYPFYARRWPPPEAGPQQKDSGGEA